MSNDKKQKITYTVNFRNDQSKIYSATCDFAIENSRIDFTTCPIISEIFKSGAKKDFKINSLESIDVELDPKVNILPKVLAGATSRCAQCKMKHREREAG